MKITNIHNLPDEIVKTITSNNYNKGLKTDYSITELLKPPQIVMLEKRHHQELEEDVSEGVWMLMGNIAHKLLEEQGKGISEERLYTTVLNNVISGQADLWYNEQITDYKVTSVWSVVYDSRKKDWENQLNMYAYLFRIHNFLVNKVQIVAILRDWNKNESLRNPDYPKIPIQVIPIDLWTIEKQVAYLNLRVGIMEANKSFADDKLSACTKEEMWEKETKWALMKEGQKRAVKLLLTEKEANEEKAYLNFATKKHYVQERPGERTRCESYCSVNQFCHQYKQYKNVQNNNNIINA